MIILQILDAPSDCDACLSFLALAGIVALAGAAGYLICTFLDRNPTTGLNQKLISNEAAFGMIKNYQDSPKDDTASGHLDLGHLLAYIDVMKKQCSAVNKPLSGLQYYFAKYLSSEPSENKNCSTVVIFPTYEMQTEDGEVGHMPFDPFLSSQAETVSVAELNGLWKSVQAGNAAPAGKGGWLANSNNSSNYVALDKSNMSPPKKPITL